MGSVHDIMEIFALRDIRSIFSEFDGWVSKPLATGNGHHAYKITRNSPGFYGKEQNVYLQVSFDFRPPPECISNLAMLGSEDRNRKGMFLLVPRGADISDVPPSVKIFPMTSFGFKNGQLRWLSKKKNVVDYSERVASTNPR